MHGNMHALGSGVDQPGLHLHHVADQQRAVEADAAGEHRHRVLPAVPRGADIGRLVDPLHDDAAMDLAAPVHVRRRRHEPQDHPLGGAGVGIFLGVHGLDDVFADLDPGQRVVALLRFPRGVTGSNCGTGMGLPSSPTATKITMHWLRIVAGPPLGSPEETTVRICMEERPV